MNTNNEQAKAEQRAPLKSNEELFAVWKRIADMPGHFILEAVHQELHLLRDFYEATITSGELRVVKRARLGNEKSPFCCSECGAYLGRIMDPRPNFCHGCGNPISPE